MKNDNQPTGLEIAVIGMAGRFPCADNLEQYWDNLKNGVECIWFFSEEELTQRGISPEVLNNPDYVKANGELQDKDYFDHSFFGYSPKEAEIMDPQIRVFHELAWGALEQAGYEPTSFKGSIGLYGGGSDNFRWRALELVKGLGKDLGTFGRIVLNNGFFLGARVSHKLNLKGPSLTFFSACSTSLVAIHLACRALLMGECDLALAGGVSMVNHAKIGYMYEEGMILSPDGHCRTFDLKAKGSVYGEGVGIVVLKRLKPAIKDRDTIHAVIKSTAFNNDGLNKASFTAPGSGIAPIIKEALNLARVTPEKISYVEAHGTATPIGDTLEMKALIQAFQSNSNSNGSCRIGSAKTNIGHLDAASGVAAFIKTILALKHKLIPPSLHFENPNPEIDFENSPFKVNTELSPWTNGRDASPLIAGVNGFGIGGNNAFVVVQEAPGITASPEEQSREWKLLLLSARSEIDLDKTTENLKNYLETYPEVNFADAAYTLQVGRKAFQYRRMAVCRDNDEAISILSTPVSRKIKTFLCKVENPEVIFMFPGLGSQYANMGAELYQKEKVFRQELDHCFDILIPLLGVWIKDILYPEQGDPKAVEVEQAGLIMQPEISQPVIFIFEYALAKLLLQWGIKPQAMIGYGFGEYVAACLAGALSLQDALDLIVYQGQLIKEIPPGLMLSVPLPKEELVPLLLQELTIGIDNGSSCVVSGPKQEIEAFEKKMKEKRCLCMRLPLSHAIHSKMMNPIIEAFKEKVRQVSLNQPQIPYISNVTGNWVTGEEVTDPGYWAEHLAGTVKFADGIKELVKKPNAVFIEIGPGHDLSALVQRHIDKESHQQVLNLIRHSEKNRSDVYLLLSKIGQLWLYGKSIDWTAFHSEEKRYRVPLPTYPFNPQQFRVEGDPFQLAANMISQQSPFAAKPDLADWFYTPSWKRLQPIALAKGGNTHPAPDQTDWLIFIDEKVWGDRLVKRMEEKHRQITLIRAGTAFASKNKCEYIINPANDDDYEVLFKKIKEEKGYIPGKMIHLWSITTPGTDNLSLLAIDRVLDLGYYCLLNIAKAIGKLNIEHDIQVIVVTNNMQEVGGEKQLCPEKATMLGPVKGIQKEYGNIRLRSIDVILPGPGREEELIDSIINECVSEEVEPIIALRHHHRWQQIYEAVHLDGPGKQVWRLKDDGVYLITGGLGGIGHVLAEYIARTVKHPKLIMTGRTPLPGPGEWDQWLETHDENDNTSVKIRKVRGLEAIGAEVWLGTTEASNLDQMQQVISQAQEHLGPINGILHSAGIPDGVMIQVRTRENSEIVFSSKVKGTLVLEAIFKNVKLDFFALCSSMDSILSNAGHVGYCSANSFLNAYAHYKHNKDGIFTVSINWPRWQSLGMAVIQENLHKELKGNDLAGGLSIEKGVDAFSRILAAIHPQVAVNANDLNAVYERDKTVGTEAFMEKFNTADAPLITAADPYVPPGNRVEEKMIELWSEVLGAKKEAIGIDRNFFEIGGHSLRATMLVAKMHQAFSVKVPLTKVFINPTIRGLTQYIRESVKDRYASIQPVEKKEYYPLSPAQKRLYVLNHLDLKSTAYNMSEAIFLQEEPDVKQLGETFKKLITRHESLRTSFHAVNDQPVQRIHKEVEFNIEYCELAREQNKGESRDEAAAEVEARMKIDLIKNFIRPFDLSQVPLLRVKLVQVRSHGKYILLVDMHHIISDGVSRQILVQDFAALTGGEQLPPPRLQYKDYVEWLNHPRQQAALEKQETYWLHRYQGEIPVLNLPIDYSRPQIQSFEGAVLGFIMSSEDTRQLKSLAVKNDVTLYMVLQAIYDIFLFKVTGQEDVVVGTGAAGRRHHDLRDIMGIFVNTVVIRNYSQPGKPFEQFLQEVKETTLEAFENQEYPFEELVEKVNPRKDTSRNPLFDTMLMLQNIELPGNAPRTPANDTARTTTSSGLNIRDYSQQHTISKFDLTLFVSEVKNELHCSFEYCTRLFKPGTIREFINYFKEAAISAATDPDQSLKEISRVSRERKESIIRQLNQELQQEAADLIEPGMTLQSKLKQSFQEYPGRVAIEKGEQTVTYSELSRKAGIVTQAIIEKGIPRSASIGILLEERVELIAVMMGILNAGSVFVPLNSSSPRKRLNSMIRAAGIRLVVTGSDNDGKWDEPVESMLIHCLYSSSPGAPEISPAKLSYGRDDCIYIYFTSGSTGTPRAIMGRNRGLLHFINWEIETFAVKEGSRFSQFITPVFDAFLRDVFVPLCTGGVICIPGGQEIMAQTRQLVQWVERSRVYLIHCAPVLFRLLVPGQNREHQADREGEAALKFKDLKYILLSGERINPVDLRGWYEIFKERIQLVNLWGTSETTLAKTYYFIRPDDVNRERIPVGKPLPGVRVVVLDENLEICDPLVTGHLYIKTPFRTLGYHNEPTLNRECFIPDPFSRDHRVLLHKTGDLGKILSDGTIDVAGRNDRQVKINGIRVELEEIESVLSRHECVSEAVALKKKISAVNELLCAYITEKEQEAGKEETKKMGTVAPDKEPHPERIQPNKSFFGESRCFTGSFFKKRPLAVGDQKESSVEERYLHFLSERLPTYMVPGKLIILEKMPRKPNGKVDHDALPEPLTVAPVFQKPREPVEEKLLELWSDILKSSKEQISVTHSFFELGGNSLHIMTLIARIHREFDTRMPLAEIFLNPTIEKQAALIRSHNVLGMTPEDRYSSIQPVEDKEYYMLSSAQKRLFILKQMDVESTVYNMPEVIVFREEPGRKKLQDTFKKLIKRHESLRTSFHMIDGQPVQKVHPEVEFNLDLHDTRYTHEGRDFIKRFIRPFDLAKAPLIRAGLIKEEDKCRGLIIDMHHIISDGTSHEVLKRDFMYFYNGEELLPLRLQYKDFAQWQNSEKVKKDLKLQEEYWLKEFLGEIPVLALPVDFARPAIQSFEGDTINFLIGREESNGLKNMVSKAGGTSFMVMLNLFNILLAKLSGQVDIVVGTDIEGRTHTDTRDIIGMFVNTLALRNFPAPGKTFKEFLGQVKDRTLKAFENQDYQFEELVEKLYTRRNVSRNPIFDVMFTFMDIKTMTRGQDETGSRETSTPGPKTYSYEDKTSKFDLTLNVYETNEGFFFSFEYCTKLFKKETIERFTRYFQRIVTTVIKNPTVMIGDIAILSRKEQEHFLTVTRNNEDKTFLKDLIKDRQPPTAREANFDF